MATQQRSGLVTTGIVLIILGVVALGVLLALAVPTGGPLHRYAPWYSSGQGSYSSLGERIYLTGTDETGRPIPRSGGIGMMSTALGCADCHGRDGKGRTINMMMGRFTSLDIRWSVLTSPQDPEGKPQTPFTEVSFAHAVRDGIDPEGQRLKSPMPLWQLTDGEVRALVQYLQTL
jgi:cytochrome c oxidase subunit II